MNLTELSARQWPSVAVAERAGVEIGDSSGEMIVVTGPLHEGDRVAIRDQKL